MDPIINKLKINFNTEINGSEIICSMNGKIDTIASQEIENELSEIDFKGKSLCFDIQNVEYISSAFLRICVKMSKTVGQNNFKLVNVKPELKKVLKIAGLDTLLKTD